MRKISLTEIRTRLTRLMAAISKRDLIILGTILAGKAIEIAIFGGDEIFIANISNMISNLFHYNEWVYYYTKYTISFIRSFLVLILCGIAILYTDSRRLAYGLNLFIIVSMGCDLLSIISADIYYMIRPYRYTNPVNFRDLYTIFEVMCVIWTIAGWIINYHINKRTKSDTVMDDDHFNIHIS